MSDIDRPTPGMAGVPAQGAWIRRGYSGYVWWVAGLVTASLALTLAALYLLRADALTGVALNTKAYARILSEQTARTVQTIDHRPATGTGDGATGAT